MSKQVLIGRILSGVVVLPFLASVVGKFSGGPEVVEGMAKMGLPQEILFPLALLELACVVIYLVPPTAMLGAILLTGYLGGAILTHLRVSDAYVVQPILGVIVWLALWLRDERIRALIPLRKVN